MEVIGLIIGFVLLIVGLSFILSVFAGSPPIPTTLKTRKKAIELIKKYDNKTKTIFEVGCAWGGFALLLSKTFPDKKIIAYEISPVPYFVSKLRAIISRRKNIFIYYGNAFLAIKEVKPDVTFMYLCPQAIDKENIGINNTNEIVVINSYPYENQEPLEVIEINKDIARSKLYVYKGKSQN